MGSIPVSARFEAAVHSPTVDARRGFQSIIEAVIWIAETVESAPADEYALGTVRDPRGILIAAADNRDRTWTQADGPAGQISEWSGICV